MLLYEQTSAIIEMITKQLKRYGMKYTNVHVGIMYM